MGSGADARGLIARAVPTALGLALLAALIGACDSSASSPSPSAAPLASSPYQRQFGPIYPDVVPPRAAVAIDAVWMPRDRSRLFVSFIGGPGYARTDPCSEDYAGWAGLDGDRLVATVATVPHPERPPIVHVPGQPLIACSAVGYPYVFELRLPVPFRGSEVRDIQRGALWLAPPERIADLPAIPTGWSLGTITTEPTLRELVREYRPSGLDPVRNVGRYLALSQAFGGPGSERPIVANGTVPIHGIDVPIGANGDAGLIVSWWLGADRLTLISYDPDLDRDAFVQIANGVAIPNR